jgi:hypothetical protein
VYQLRSPACDAFRLWDFSCQLFCTTFCLSVALDRVLCDLLQKPVPGHTDFSVCSNLDNDKYC